MKIEGFDSISRVDVAKAIIEFIFKNNLTTEDVIVNEVDRENYIYSINEVEYVIIPSYEANSIVSSYNDDLFDDSVTELRPTYWIEYIDSGDWIRDNGVSCFEDYFEQVNDKCIEFDDIYAGLDLYKFV